MKEANLALELGTKYRLFMTIKHTRGNLVWLKRGLILIEKIKKYLNCFFPGYEVQTPQVYKEELWKKSGHLTHFIENMYCIHNTGYLKPMSCPAHFMIFSNWNISFKDLPLRIKEYGLVNRKEAYGAIKVPFRMLAFTQDDGHTLITESQLTKFIFEFIRKSEIFYTKAGFASVQIKLCLSTTNHPRIRLANLLAINSVIKMQRKVILNRFDGAFYGPKFELHLLDNKKKYWQCGTIQIDMLSAKNFNIRYNHNITNKHPLILHHACLGSIERFIGILLENSKSGYLPIFLDPEPVRIMIFSESLKNDFPFWITGIKYIGIDNIREGMKISNTLKTPIILFYGKEEQAIKSVKVKYMNSDIGYMTFDNYRIFFKRLFISKGA